jgi:hypothetical protein
MIVDVQSLWISTMLVLVRDVGGVVGASGVSKRKPDGSRIARPQTSAQGMRDHRESVRGRAFSLHTSCKTKTLVIKSASMHTTYY